MYWPDFVLADQPAPVRRCWALLLSTAATAKRKQLSFLVQRTTCSRWVGRRNAGRFRRDHFFCWDYHRGRWETSWHKKRKTAWIMTPISKDLISIFFYFCHERLVITLEDVSCHAWKRSVTPCCEGAFLRSSCSDPDFDEGQASSETPETTKSDNSTQTITQEKYDIF